MNDFYSPFKIFSTVTKLQGCRQEHFGGSKNPTLLCQATKCFVPRSSLTAILHRGMLFREHDQLKFLLLTFLVIQKSLLVSDANKVAKIKNW